MEESYYTKEDIISAERFKRRRDLIEALLDDDKLYTLDEVLEKIEKFMKGCV